MVSLRNSHFVLKAIFIISFALILIPCLANALWVLLSTLDWGWPIPWLAALTYVLFIAQVLSLILYFRRPWIAAAISWFDLILIFSGVFPRNAPATHGILRQFGFDIVFFAGADLGLIAYYFLHRASNGIASTTRDSRL